MESLGLVSIGFAVVASELITSVFIIKYFANKELAKLNSRIPNRIQILALSTVFVTGVTFLSVYLKFANIYITCLIGIFIQIIIYCRMFINLSDDLKMRFAGFYKVINWLQ